MSMRNVAVIGAGPGGLAAARYLKSEGFAPVIFEQGKCIGGQWSADSWSQRRMARHANQHQLHHDRI